MAKPKFNVPVTFRLSPALKDWVSDYANRANVNEADIYRNAITDYLGKHDVPNIDTNGNAIKRYLVKEQPFKYTLTNPPRVTSTFDVATPDRNMEEISIVVSQLKELLERLNTVTPSAVLFDEPKSNLISDTTPNEHEKLWNDLADYFPEMKQDYYYEAQ